MTAQHHHVDSPTTVHRRRHIVFRTVTNHAGGEDCASRTRRRAMRAPTAAPSSSTAAAFAPERQGRDIVRIATELPAAARRLRDYRVREEPFSDLAGTFPRRRGRLPRGAAWIAAHAEAYACGRTGWWGGGSGRG